MEYIEREAARNIFTPPLRDPESLDFWEWLQSEIDAIPAADVRPVVKAKWEWNDNNGYYYCGNCKAVSPREDQDGEYIDCPNYCPNCGAWMEES